MCWVVCEVLGTQEARGIKVPHSTGIVLSSASFSLLLPPPLGDGYFHYYL